MRVRRRQTRSAREYAPATLRAALALACFLLARTAHPQFRLYVLDSTPTNFTLGWTQPGLTNAYTVQYRSDMADHPWLNAPHTAPWPITTLSWRDPRTNAAQQQFYRVIAVEQAQRGRLLAAMVAGAYSRALLGVLFGSYGIPVTPQYGVELVKLRYETIGPVGNKTIASGLIALPQGAATNLPIASYQHGTITRTNDAPSVTTSLTGDVLVGLVMASSGYVTAIADYLGLGDAPPLHPYHHAWTEATACVDMLRATRAYCASRGLGLSGKLFLMGYSQGGHATMALHRELETYHADEFTVTASAPMAGAYDLSGTTLDDFLSDRPKPNPYYYAYLLAAYHHVYTLAPRFEDILAAPYNTTLPPLLRGNAAAAEINAAMPPDPRQMLDPEYLAAVQQRTNHPFRILLRENDVYGWAPRAPVRLYHCGGDQDVLIANAHIATNSMRARGATNVTLLIPSPSNDHRACALPSLLAAKAWFDTLK
ncbi:MAG: hypothetical protein N2379_06235 [Verrucomicrobiae bacterium]|nr:hypothetical protein [Verrucomicrobiae bacterium]